MRRILIFLFFLAGLWLGSAVRAQEANAKAAARTGELPIYRQYRVLSGLPWKEPGATRKTVLERIFREPEPLVRNEVLHEYLHSVLPVEEFPAAYDECVALEEADFPSAAPQLVMRAWAERDPLAASQKCRTLFDLVMEGAPLGFSHWSTPIPTGDLEKVRASRYWFGGRGVIHACWKGIGAALLLPELRKEVEAEFSTLYARRFKEELPESEKMEEPARRWVQAHFYLSGDHPPTISTDAGLRKEFLRVLAAPPEEMPGMLQWPHEPWDDLLFSRALIRWMNGDAKKAPQIVERVLDGYDPRHYYRSEDEMMDVIPTEFLLEWGILDRDGFLSWAGDHTGWWRALAVSLTVMPKEKKKEVEDKVWGIRSKAVKSKCLQLWIKLNPEGALPVVYRDVGEDDIERAFEDVWRSDPPANYWRRLSTPYADLQRRSGENELWGTMKAWAPADFRGMIKRYGLPWCLHSQVHPEAEVIGVFMNRVPNEGGSGLGYTLSALRVWATVRPKEMREWIEGEKLTPELREALLWVLENAGGGFVEPAAAETR